MIGRFGKMTGKIPGFTPCAEGQNECVHPMDGALRAVRSSAPRKAGELFILDGYGCYSCHSSEQIRQDNLAWGPQLVPGSVGTPLTIGLQRTITKETPGKRLLCRSE